MCGGGVEGFDGELHAVTKWRQCSGHEDVDAGDLAEFPCCCWVDDAGGAKLVFLEQDLEVCAINDLDALIGHGQRDGYLFGQIAPEFRDVSLEIVEVNDGDSLLGQLDEGIGEGGRKRLDIFILCRHASCATEERDHNDANTSSLHVVEPHNIGLRIRWVNCSARSSMPRSRAASLENPGPTTRKLSLPVTSPSWLMALQLRVMSQETRSLSIGAPLRNEYVRRPRMSASMREALVASLRNSLSSW